MLRTMRPRLWPGAGRKARLVRMEEGQNRVKYEARNASGLTTSSTMELINVHERKLFLSGQKLVAVISEAASAGISLHADRWGLMTSLSKCELGHFQLSAPISLCTWTFKGQSAASSFQSSVDILLGHATCVYTTFVSGACTAS